MRKATFSLNEPRYKKVLGTLNLFQRLNKMYFSLIELSCERGQVRVFCKTLLMLCPYFKCLSHWFHKLYMSINPSVDIYGSYRWRLIFKESSFFKLWHRIYEFHTPINPSIDVCIVQVQWQNKHRIWRMEINPGNFGE